MADTTALKNRIRAAIKANDNQEITGPVLQQTLLDIVDELDLNPELEKAVTNAIQDVYKKSNYNYGDNIIDFNTIHLITDNPEFVCVVVDANDKILYGIKTDGQPYFGVGCPQQVKDYKFHNYE